MPVYADNFTQAVSQVRGNIDVIEQRVNDILVKSGKDYTARCSLENFYFDTTQYDDFVLPQGEYTALTVRLGKAEGNNWWCVMFPPLCLPAVSENNEESVYSVFGENGGNLVTGKSGYIIKLRIVEIVENIIAAVRS